MLRGVFAIVLLVMTGQEAAAQEAAAQEAAAQEAAAQEAADSQQPGRKSGAVATILGVFLPGAGHIYAGETGRGALFAAGTGLAFMYGFGDGRCKRPYTDVRTCETDKSETLSAASFVSAFVIYGVSIWDAHRAARRTNAKRAADPSTALTSPRIVSDPLFSVVLGVRSCSAICNGSVHGSPFVARPPDRVRSH